MIIKYPYFDDLALKKQGTNFMLMLYPDSNDYDTYKILKYIEVLESNNQDVKQYAYILHDKEKDVKPHYHICIKYYDRKQVKYVLNQFQLWNYNPNENEVIIKKDKWYGALNYLIHNTKDSLDKYQYPEEEVISNIPEVINDLRNSKDTIDIFNDIVDFINYTDGISYRKVIEYCNSHSREYIKCFQNRTNNFIFSNLIKERNCTL